MFTEKIFQFFYLIIISADSRITENYSSQVFSFALESQDRLNDRSVDFINTRAITLKIFLFIFLFLHC